MYIWAFFSIDVKRADTDMPFLIDEQSFASLYKTNWKKVFGVCYHLLRDTEASKEIAQDVFESIWTRRESLIIKGNPEAYLIRAAKLETFDYIRKIKIRENYQIEERTKRVSSSHSTEEAVIHNELLTRLNATLALLPVKSRTVYELSRSGLSRIEIAKQLDLCEKTVEYHLYKAQNFLRSHLSYSAWQNPTVHHGFCFYLAGLFFCLCKSA